LVTERCRVITAIYSRKQIWGKALTITEAAADAATFADRFTVLEDGPAVWDRLVELCRRFSFRGRQGP
jgi:hypothetical protein